ncbi:MAG: hypothetical protein IPK13_27680 [Deltaproteobacteria bacterium]|nr:hypothetical protein [Deltaproteobacteria bacterium]
MARKEAEQGAKTEELLVSYFLRQGYFVARGLKLRHEEMDVTDVDLWLYKRSSALIRERLIVDAKDRTRPKAMERILWATGVRRLLGIDRCIVATTDKRPAVKRFAAQLDVLVLDGEFLARLENATPESTLRLSHEDFEQRCFPKGDERLVRDWRGRYEVGRSRLVNQLDFDGCNGWLDDAVFFFDESRVSTTRDVAMRLAYASMANLLVGLDWMMRDISFEQRDQRHRDLEAGFRFGNRGREGFEELLRVAEDLIVRFSPDMKGLAATMRNRAHDELTEIPAAALAEVVAKPDVFKELFNVALELDRAAFGTSPIAPSSLGVTAQAIIGAVLDFGHMPRAEFLGAG